MTRKEKIKLLQDIKAGIKKITSLFEPLRPIWIQDNTTGLFSCRELDMVRKENQLPTFLNGREVKNIVIIPGNAGSLDIRETED